MAHRHFLFIGLFLITISSCTDDISSDNPGAKNMVVRKGDSENGRLLFVDKGCITCHAINGVGGKAAPPLDAQTELDPVDPVGFAARMWRGAPAMVELQSIELGYTIWLESQEMVDLAAFSADALEQKKLLLQDIDEGLIDSFLDEGFWETEDWNDFLKNGQEGFDEPPNKK